MLVLGGGREVRETGPFMFFLVLCFSLTHFPPVERLRRVVRAWTCLSTTIPATLEKPPQQLRHHKRNDDNHYY